MSKSTDWAITHSIKVNDILKDTYELLKTLIVIFIILTILVLVISIYVVNKSVLIPLGGEPSEIEKIVSELANGNLSQTFTVSGKETGIYA